jgi:hypothetical protein
MSEKESGKLQGIAAIAIVIGLVILYFYQTGLIESPNNTRSVDVQSTPVQSTPVQSTTHVQTQREYTLHNSFVSTSQSEIVLLNTLLLSGDRTRLFEYIDAHDSALFIRAYARVIVVERVGGLTSAEYVRIEMNGHMYWTIPESLTPIR